MNIYGVVCEYGSASPLVQCLQSLQQSIARVVAGQNFVKSASATAAGVAIVGASSGPLVTTSFTKTATGTKLVVVAAANVTATAAIGVGFRLMVGGVQQGATYFAEADAGGNISVTMEAETTGAAGATTIELVADVAGGSTVTVLLNGATLVIEEVRTLGRGPRAPRPSQCPSISHRNSPMPGRVS